MSPAYEPAGSDVTYSDVELRQAAAAFARPITAAGLLQLLTSLAPFAAGCAAMYFVFPVSYLFTVALALPTGALLVRVFIIQHDCGHGSFLVSRRANTIVGRMRSVLTLTPYAHWGRQHWLHHAQWNNLEHSSGSDIYSACLTMREYLARPAVAALSLPRAASPPDRPRAAAAVGVHPALSPAVRHAA